MEIPLLQLAFAHLLAAKAGAWALRRARRGGVQQSSTDVAPTGRAPRRAGISASPTSGAGSVASATASSKSRPGTKGPRRNARVIATASITAQGPGFSYQAPPEAPAEEPLHAPVPLEWLQPTSASPCPPPTGKALASRLRPKQPRRSGPAADLAPLPWGSRLARREQHRRATTASDADGSSTDTEARDVVAAPASDPKHWASPARWLPARNLAPTPLAGAAVEPQTPSATGDAPAMASTCPDAATYDWRLGEPWFEALAPSDKDASGEEELQLPGGPSLLTAAMEHIMSRLQSLPPLHPHPLGGPNPLAWLAGAPAPPADADASPTSTSTPSSPSGSPTSAAATPAWPLPGFGGTPAPASAAAAPPTAIQPAEAPPPQLVATRGGTPAAAAAALSAAGDALGLNAFAERAVEGPVRGLRELNKTLTANFVDFLSSDSGRRLSEQVAAEMSSGALMAPVYLTEELVKARLKSLVTSHARFLIIFFSLRVVIATAALHATKVALQQVVAHVHTRSPRRRWRWLRASVDYVLDVLLPTGFFGPALGLAAGILQLTGMSIAPWSWHHHSDPSSPAPGTMPQDPLAAALPAVAAAAGDAVVAAAGGAVAAASEAVVAAGDAVVAAGDAVAAAGESLSTAANAFSGMVGS
ncbi:hypothetical protein HYH03_013905 [Edaphochlamys debaryana]|uniref:Uncharacterized protein n=2 Tax=Edaphochlamys debaryana TaxID=47281 RepID=A0A835XPX8_9CHLO|nr:hypothetical protein HYH03_013905 [Edaphochlamys debaryana]|eukprot:KAG2487485.1 hypothetical protein HYH03_013905 [Edaphochlamys debaryana]